MQNIIEYTAQDFAKTMKEESFESFREMAGCYMWSPEEIKEEVESILKEYEEETGRRAWIDEEDGKTVYTDGSEMEYKTFIAEGKKTANKIINS